MQPLSHHRQIIGEQEFELVSGLLVQQGLPVLAVAVFIPAREVDSGGGGGQLMEAVLVTSAGLILIAGLLGQFLAGRISRPIRKLSAAARRIRAGEFDQRVDWASSDEIGVLVDSFNRMAASLGQQRDDLRRRKDYIEAIVANATTGVVSITPDGGIATMNPAAAVMLGLDEPPPAGTNLIRFLASRPALGRLAGLLAAPAPADPGREEEITLPGRSGDTLHLRVVRVPLPAQDRGSSPGSILLIEDVSETVRSSQLAAWAEMARGIAHEVKNPLTPILLSAEHIRRLQRDRGPAAVREVEECLQTIVEQVEELRQISREFSDYARLPKLHREPTAIAEFLHEILEPYRRAAPPGIRIRLDSGDRLPAVNIDRRLIRRALVNLIENAMQAMPSGGTLTIEAGHDDSRPGLVRIAVTDTGEGIEPESRKRLFEPYFSTREAGTGLGLAVTRRAVEQHGGRIEVDSRRGRGTTMTLFLPVGTATGPPGSKAPAETG
jgi:two-component system nitrogen regulation sensor histidine kinase NtrY